MKQSLYAIGMIILIVSGQASAQTTAKLFNTKSAVINRPFVLGNSAPADAAGIAVIALERFRKDYKDAKDVEWAEVPNGYRAWFLQDAVLTAVDYSRKGKLISVIRYGDHLLSPDLKMKLEQTFDELQLREVAEVKMTGFATKVIMVVLEDKSSVKTVQIIDDDISVLNVMDK